MPPKRPGHTKMPSATNATDTSTHSHGFPPPRSLGGLRVAERRGQVRLRELGPTPQDLLRRRPLPEHQQEPQTQGDQYDERQHEQDVAGLHDPA